jgi:3-hydroxyisobutyrate dehydrogenase-like beta-hydroxyacid dehydrogenase
VVYGLGEAGSLIAAALAAAGLRVIGFDPKPVATPAGVTRSDDPGIAATEADVLLGITAAVDSAAALGQAIGHAGPGSLYADLSTSRAQQMAELAARSEAAGVAFVDVALVATVPGKGLATPALAAGSGAERFCEIFVPLGMPVVAVSEQAGGASARKLLRSVVMKGLAALLDEALAGADAMGSREWLWANIVAEVAAADEELLVRLMEGSERHAVRRRDEMAAAAEQLEDLGVDATMTRATRETLRARVEEAGRSG